MNGSMVFIVGRYNMQDSHLAPDTISSFLYALFPSCHRELFGGAFFLNIKSMKGKVTKHENMEN